MLGKRDRYSEDSLSEDKRYAEFGPNDNVFQVERLKRRVAKQLIKESRLKYQDPSQAAEEEDCEETMCKHCKLRSSRKDIELTPKVLKVSS